ASTLVLQARSEIDAGRLDSADALLTAAQAIDASSAELAATAVALATARDAVAADAARRRQAEADRQAAAERQAELDRQAEADRLAAEARDKRDREAAAAAAAAVTTQAVAGDNASANDRAETSPQGVGEAAASKGADEQAAVTEPVMAAGESASGPAEVGDQQPIAMRSLNRTRYVAPKYPRTAQRRGVSGWVDVVFTVGTDGSVKDIEIKKAEPEGVFDGAAMRAVEKWEFEPIVENGEIVEKRAGVRLMFALE
ncbi:MAG: energy transducer TonB, partial [Woeseiaceae bacterium]